MRTKQKKHFTLDIDIVERIELLAKETTRSRSEVANTLLKEGLRLTEMQPRSIVFASKETTDLYRNNYQKYLAVHPSVKAVYEVLTPPQQKQMEQNWRRDYGV